MKQLIPFPWDVSPAEAMRLQEKLREQVVVAGGPAPENLRLVAGLDVSFCRRRGLLFGAVVILRLPDFIVTEESTAVLPPPFPYVPGLLAFREGPVLLAALRKIASVPDLLVCDGQGIAHPRGVGIASHLGVLLGIPAIGVAKSRLVGNYEAPPPMKGATSPLFLNGKVVGSVLRTRTGVKPVFVSPGHLVGVEAATRLALSLCTRFRLPEPVRAAHHLSRRLFLHHATE
ncbi:endonuclease V [Thermodesulfitimonas sp.]